MASIVSAGTTSATALNMSADTSGVLQLASNNGTVAVTVDTGQILAMGTTDTTNTSRLKLSSSPTNNRAVSAQLTVQRTSASTQYEGVCFNTGSARAAYILRIPGSDDLTFGFDAGSVTAEVMRITTAGSLGIGTTTPNARLNVYASGATFPLIRAQSDSPTSSGVYGQFNAKYGGTDRDWFFGQASDGSFNIWDYTPGVTSRLIITTGGIVGVATTTPDTAFQMTVASTGFATTRVNFGQGAGYVDGSTIYCGSDNTNPTSWVDNANFRFGSNRQGCVVAINPGGYTYEGGSGGGSRTFAVNSNGNVQNSNNSYGSLSDAKLKENITDATPKLESLMRVKIRNFNLIADEAKTKQIGVVAQELEEIFPSMIEEHIDYTFESYVREDGVTDSKGIPTGTVTKEVKYSVFVPMLVKAIQELNAKVTALEEQVLNLGVK